MCWVRVARGAAFVLVAVEVIQLFESTMAMAAPLTEQVLQACKAAAHTGAQREPDVERNTSTPTDIDVLHRGAIRVVRQGDFLLAYTRTEPDDVVALPQPDYGAVRAVHVDRTGGLVAIGDQISYRVTIELADGRAHFGLSEAFPTLFAQPCGPVSQLVGACQPARAVFSYELRVGLIEGFDRWGRARCMAVGLREGERVTPLEAPQGGALLYWFDVPSSGGALFKARNRIAYLFFDGKHMRACPE